MTEQEALEVARKQIRAENAAYMREWRKRNPEKDRAIRNRYQHTEYAMIDGQRVFLNRNSSVTVEDLTDKYSVQIEGKLDHFRKFLVILNT